MTDTAVGDLALLELMLADRESAPELYRPTAFWKTGSAAIVSDLRKRGPADFRSHPSATTFYVPTYGERSPRALAVAGLLRRIRQHELLARVTNRHLARYDHAVATQLDTEGEPVLQDARESLVGNPVERLSFDGTVYSRSFLNYLRGLVFFKRSVPDARVSTVLEIGGGFGTLGEILLQGNPGLRYVDVDIPPVAFVATWYLRQVFGAGRITAYDETRDREEIRLEDLSDGAVLCSWQLPRLVGTVDLFVNFISFQEMEPAVVRNYVEDVRRLNPQYVLLRNSTTGKPVMRKPGQLGVREPVVRSLYLELFEGYELVASDHALFGNASASGITSEVLVLRRT